MFIRTPFFIITFLVVCLLFIAVKKIHKIEFTITQTEREALILENSLIKEHKPKFNVLLKDRKSYPFIEVSISDKYPKVAFHRGKKNHSKAKYFGPYPNVNAVRSTISQLQKIFQLRNCDQSFFKNRSRPCLQHQIKRCSAPCVGLINEEDYSFSVFQAMEYLKGNNQNIINQLIEKMDQASSLQNYEKALIFRNQISSLKAIQAHQYADGGKPINLDAIALTRKSDIFCIAVLFVRAGRILGSRTFFPVKTEFADESEVLESFLTQYYLMHEPPKEILIDKKLINIKVIQETFSSVKGIKIAIKNAKKTGIGLVAVKNSGHYGVSGYYAEQAVKKGLMVLVFTNAPPAVAPHGALKSLF
mgnify:CR=1 FL=1